MIRRIVVVPAAAVVAGTAYRALRRPTVILAVAMTGIAATILAICAYLAFYVDPGGGILLALAATFIAQTLHTIARTRPKDPR